MTTTVEETNKLAHTIDVILNGLGGERTRGFVLLTFPFEVKPTTPVEFITNAEIRDARRVVSTFFDAHMKNKEGGG